MAITVQNAAEWAGVSLAAEDAIGSVDIANQAGEHLVNVHAWRWLSVRSAIVYPRSDISIAPSGTFVTGISSTSGGNRIIIDPAIPDYTWVVGDKLKITAQSPDAGANQAALGEHKIVAKVADDVIITETSVNAEEGKRISKCSGKIVTDTVALPADFRTATSLAGQETDRRTIKWVSIDYLNDLRSRATRSASSVYYGAVIYASHKRTEYETGAGGGTTDPLVQAAQPPTPILEVFPSDTTEELTLFYKQGWTRVTEADEAVLIPEWLEPAYLQLFAHFAHGWLEADEEPMGSRLDRWRRDPITQAAIDRDGQSQPYHGLMRGGGAQRRMYGHHPIAHRFTVSMPQ